MSPARQIRPPVPTKIQPPDRAGRDAAMEWLSGQCGFGSYDDAKRILERIIKLAHGGELAVSIMCRLNPPARQGE